MKLLWYINRLRAMGPAEMLHRLGERGRRAISRRRHQGWTRYAAAAMHPVWPDWPERIRNAPPAQRATIAETADGFLDGRFSALGQAWPEGAIAPPYRALWRLDPVTGSAWPGAERYCFDIDFRHDGARGDIKYVWEINRLHMLPALAAQFALSGEARYCAAIEAVLQGWHAANPPFGGVAWASGIEVAVRAINILVTLDLMGPALPEATRALAGQVLDASTFWLARFPSLYSSANNHLVAELAGAYLIARARGGDGAGPRARLLAELERQILPDGAGAEQSPTYAAFTCELVLLCAEAARAAGDPFPQDAEARLAAFAAHVAWLGPNGRFGDDDEGRVIALGPVRDYAGAVAAAIRAYCGQPEVAERPVGLRTFAQGGLSAWHGAMNGREVALCFDHGPLGYLSIAAHGHADALSLTLSVDGKPVLVDPGTYLYGSGGTWRDWFRSTPAHNTLNIEGRSQSSMAGAFNWSHKARAQLVDRQDAAHWRLTAEHDGYRRAFGVNHRRAVARAGDTLMVEDRLVGGTGRVAEIAWQLAADIAVCIDGSRAICSRDGPVLVIDFPDGALDLGSGGTLPGGWVSPAFGHKVPAPRLRWRGRVDGAGVITRLSVPAR